MKAELNDERFACEFVLNIRQERKDFATRCVENKLVTCRKGDTLTQTAAAESLHDWSQNYDFGGSFVEYQYPDTTIHFRFRPTAEIQYVQPLGTA